MFASLGFAVLAGILSILSPCVLPLVPIILGAAAAEHRYATMALTAGLALSFVALGLFVATIGFSLGVDAAVLRSVSAVLLICLGLMMLVPRVQARLAVAAGPFGRWADERFGAVSKAGLRGQFGLGVLLGAVWSPCVGPTLGAASVLAAQGQDLSRVALIMLAFGVGAAVPLLTLGALSREAMMRWRSGLLGTGQAIKAALGLLLIVVGVAILSGSERLLEARLVDASPAWLTDLTTRF